MMHQRLCKHLILPKTGVEYEKIGQLNEAIEQYKKEYAVGAKMGIFDRLLGIKKRDEKSDVGPEIRVEAPESSKKTSTRKVNRIEICFNSTSPPYSEPEVITGLIRYFGLADSFTTDVHITTSYGHISGVAEYLCSREMPGELQAFVMARAMIIGMIHDPKEIKKIIVNPFKVSNTLGILIIKEV